MGILDGVFNAMERAFSPLSDEAAYQVVAKELAADQVDQGLWTKALVECAFNKDQAKAKYVKYRVAALQRAATQEGARQRAWYKNVEENAYVHFERGEYDLAAVGFVERVKNRKDVGAMHNLGWLAESGHVKDATVEVAIGWYRQAVDNGRIASALAISHAAYRQHHYQEAYDWAEIACKADVPGAKEARTLAAAAARIKLSWWKR